MALKKEQLVDIIDNTDDSKVGNMIKDLAKQKLSSKPAKAAETTEKLEAAVQKTLTQNRQNIPRSSQQNDKSKKPNLLSICTGILGFFDILQFEISSWIFFLV